MGTVDHAVFRSPVPFNVVLYNQTQVGPVSEVSGVLVSFGPHEACLVTVEVPSNYLEVIHRKSSGRELHGGFRKGVSHTEWMESETGHVFAIFSWITCYQVGRNGKPAYRAETLHDIGPLDQCAHDETAQRIVTTRDLHHEIGVDQTRDSTPAVDKSIAQWADGHMYSHIRAKSHTSLATLPSLFSYTRLLETLYLNKHDCHSRWTAFADYGERKRKSKPMSHLRTVSPRPTDKMPQAHMMKASLASHGWSMVYSCCWAYRCSGHGTCSSQPVHTSSTGSVTMTGFPRTSRQRSLLCRPSQTWLPC
jgi:hypothetical protein